MRPSTFLRALAALAACLATAAAADEWAEVLAAGDAVLASAPDAAIRLYTDAIDLGGGSTVLYKRAVAHLALKRPLPALRDLQAAVAADPGFGAAEAQRSRLALRLGFWDDVAAADAANASAGRAAQAEAEGAGDDAAACVAAATRGLEIAPDSAALRRTRAQCHLAAGAVREAATDLSRVHTPAEEDRVLLARLHGVYIGDVAAGVAHVQRCLHRDPEAKACKTLFRLLKKTERALAAAGAARDAGRWADVRSQAETARAAAEAAGAGAATGLPQAVVDALVLECAAALALRDWDSPSCPALRAADADAIDALLFDAHVRMNADDLAGAQDVLNRANDLTSGGNRAVADLLAQLRVLVQRANTVDHYKTLGVARDATTAEIRRAFRAQTKQYHPDKYRGDMTAEQVERKMASINLAYETLGDDEKRRRYDLGEDENPQQGYGGSPFGGSPFGGGGFQFQQGFGGPFGGGAFKFQGARQAGGQGRQRQNFHFRTR
ncbi:uncharacterized protein V1510DRAFT_422854 [Dipodascopsis tothii]|uniref:uncharacterized protein n=1 Tax=Dipodascopsis tothii TaxID=44089 RepID=UPI0034CEA171